MPSQWAETRDRKEAAAMAYNKVVDADGHILEPPDLWENYLERKYKDRGIRWKVNDAGLEYLEVDGKPRVGQRFGANAALGGIGGYPDKNGDRTKLLTPGIYNYLDGAPPGAMDPHGRIQVMDQEGIDCALIYPTLGIIWEESVNDPGLTAALCRAYNNWLVDFCQPYPDRLFAIAHIPMLDVNDAVTEMRRMAKLGARGFFIRPDLIHGRTLGHLDFDPIWATAQEMDLPVAPHVVVRVDNPMREWAASLTPGPYAIQPDNLVFTFTYLMLPVQAAFTALVSTGVLQRFPRLKYVILESGGGWIAHWLDRMDGKYKVGKGFSPLKEKPSFYFQRQCYISVDPDEKTTPAMVELLGEDKFVWASDFPHIDAEYGVVAELKENIARLPESAQRKILGENAARIYCLPM
jgi:predicted TIM-barrel fold metal-dependent hydrolase